MKQLFKENLIGKKDAFLATASTDALAEVLEIKKNLLVYYTYKKPDSEKYKTFEITKRSGKKRQIQAPIAPVKLLQKKLNCLISQVYRPLHCVHGFVQKRSVVTNAKQHLRQTYILNLDLSDFFTSIHFGRVLGLFQSSTFKYPKNVSAYLAQLCTFSGYLPQGAPTSPIIANMIAYSLDKQMMALAHGNKFHYTRYSDDLTISTCDQTIGEALSNPDSELRNKIVSEIVASGFKLNSEKIRFAGKFDHKEVTGVIVNVKTNVRRIYYRQIRAMLHAWDKFGYNAAETEFKSKYDHRNRNVKDGESIRFYKVVKGKINWFRMVRGVDCVDKLYEKIHGQYISLMKRDTKIIKEEDKNITQSIRVRKLFKPSEFLENSIFIIECDEKQGTCFYLKNVGFVTCAHVVGDVNAKTLYKNHFIFRQSNLIEKFSVDKIDADYDHDIAFLQVPSLDKMSHGMLEQSHTSASFDNATEIAVCGYPEWESRRNIRIEPCKIVSDVWRFGVELIEINGGIYEGNSGGPVIDNQSRVVGVAVKGTSTIDAKFDTAAHLFLPISKVIALANNLQDIPNHQNKNYMAKN